MNVREADFVLMAGWLLQTINPKGPYAILYLNGLSEAGKSTVSKLALRTVDPTSKGLRKKPKNVEDLCIVVKNNWAVGFDNLSTLTGEWPDTLCTISTGVAVSTRKHYTNDEEHSYTVCRPLLFNGIPSDMTERADLASRTIQLDISPIVKRKSEAQIEEEFVAMWPGVLRALFDGVVVALRGGIEVEDPARLMDFEQWAEAGCRGMGFRPGEFTEAYEANRKGTLARGVDGDPVARAIRRMVKAGIAAGKGPFEGQTEALLNLLEGSY
jgi:hypothetical protein